MYIYVKSYMYKHILDPVSQSVERQPLLVAEGSSPSSGILSLCESVLKILLGVAGLILCKILTVESVLGNSGKFETISFLILSKKFVSRLHNIF